ncbi:MAG: glycyl-radical enzyme activating protein [Tannerellaceae bacterium]|jgi:pyruvate formate lyase activating enzyme|nr:glycyl-radical enzyme activating protein [Tannerellaceae bacterium]
MTDSNRNVYLSVMEIERFAIHDGPGIRTLVFLQGCPLHCPWCSNPESQQIKTWLLHLNSACIGCGMCSRVCALGNISFETNSPVFNRSACVACGACANVCLQHAIKYVGKKLSVTDVMDIVMRDKDYYLNSGGGISLSGGEAFVQFEGLMSLLRACRKEGLHCAVETSGQVHIEKMKAAFPLIDLFLFDVKHANKVLLKETTGADADLILSNLSFLAKRNPEKVKIRIPVIPGFNANEKDIKDIYYIALKNKITHIHLLPYHTLGKDKYKQLGLTYRFPSHAMLAEESLAPFKKMGESLSLQVEIGG